MSDVIQMHPAGRRAEAVRARQAARAVAPHITPSMLRPAVNAYNGMWQVPDGASEIGTGLAAMAAQLNRTVQARMVPAAQRPRALADIARMECLLRQLREMLS